MGMYTAITGASQGIGRAIALAFAAAPNARLLLIARNAANLEAVATECRALGAEATVYACDLCQSEAAKTMAEALGMEDDVPDVLINNAGRFLQHDFLSITAAQMREALDANFMSAFHMTEAVAPLMAGRKRGTLVFMGSVASLSGYPDSAAYCAAKHALLGYARSCRLALRPRGIRVTSILPGATDSPSWDSSEIERSRLMPAEDIAEAVFRTCSLSPNTVVEELVLRPLLGDV